MTITNHLARLALVASAAITSAGAAQAESGSPTSLPSFGVASVTYGPYVRLEAGYSRRSLDDAYWLPTGYPKDPRVSFDLGEDAGSIWGAAVGYDWLNGFRGDVEVLGRSSMDLSGGWTDPGPGPHADITDGTLRTTALMANVYYAPFEQRGSSSRFQPFLTAGLGFANNQVSEWTRTNAAANQQNRSYEGDNTISLAASVGFGAALQLTKPGQHPVILEAAYKYYHFGTARGGSTPLAGSGLSQPVEPLTFDVTDQVLSLSIRVPLQRF